MVLRFYLDLLSQPCRALYITLKLHNVQFEAIKVDISKKEHLSEEFTKNVSRFNKLPAISDDGFNLTESIAILRYLARTKKLSEDWYSEDPKKQARVDEYLEWQHNNTRLFCTLYFQRKYLFPKFYGKVTSPSELESYQKNMEECLEKIEKLWLTPGPYINGDRLTAADIWAACEIEQLRMAGYCPRNGREKLRSWLERVRFETNPYYDEAHKLVYKIVDRQRKPQQAKL